jgi:hypothetical protein
MIGLFVLLESFYAYRIINPPKCAVLTFQVKNSGAAPGDTLVKKGDIIFFTASVDNPNIIWDFGDNTEKRQGSVVTHAFTYESKFDVKATLGNCTYDVRRLSVVPREIKKLKVFTIVADDSAEVGKPVSFRCIDSAGAYDWSVKDYPDITAKGSGGGNIHQFTFLIENYTYTIECRIDHDKTKIATHDIYIKRKPVVTAKGPTVTAGDICNQPIPDEQLANQLILIVYNELSAGTLYKHLCNEGNTKVVANGKPYSFVEFCQKIAAIKPEDKVYESHRALKGQHRIKITVLGVDKADQSVKGEPVKNVVQTIRIQVTQLKSNVKGKKQEWDVFNKW